MNYIREINAFYDWLEINSISDSAIALWHALMHINNKAGWITEFTVAISTLETKTGLKKDAIIRARHRLQQVGRIEFKSRSGQQSAVYSIKPFEDCVGLNDTNCDTNRDTNRAQTATQTASIIKLNETKLNETNNTPPIPPPNNAHSPGGQCSSLENAGQTDLAAPTNEEHPIQSDQCAAKKAKKKKIQYAEFVSMTNDEYSSLVTRLGSEERVKRAVEILDNYKGANGKTYKSDYRAILVWVIGRLEEEEAKNRASSKGGKQGGQGISNHGEIESISAVFDREKFAWKGT